MLGGASTKGNLMKTEAVLNVLQHLQNQICWALEQQEGATQFVSDEWQSALGVEQSRVLKQGAVWEQAGVNFFSCERRSHALRLIV